LYGEWKADDIFALDCEHVHLKALKGKQRIKAGTVAVCDTGLKEVLNTKVKQLPGTYLVNKHTKAINGFDDHSLEDGRESEDVKRELEGRFLGKLVLTFDGATDFSSIGMYSGDYDHLDLAQFYRKPLFDRFGRNVGEKVSFCQF